MVLKPTAAADGAEIVIVMVPDVPEVDAALHGAGYPVASVAAPAMDDRVNHIGMPTPPTP